MTHEEILKQARSATEPLCHACPECNGRACKNTIPGPGAKGTASTSMRNYDAWKEILLNMDTITKLRPIDTSVTLLGQNFAAPIFAAPVGAVDGHYGPKYNDVTYNDILIPALKEAGLAAFTGDGANSNVMISAVEAIKANNGIGVPTVKPWNLETIKEKMALVRESESFAVAMDIDGAGLPFLKNCNPPAGAKSVEELREVIALTDKPFIIKGIMTAKGAKKALQAGAKAIIVSNHGGRVLDSCPASAHVLPEIVEAVGEEMEVFVDGGIRSGTDIFKALAMGAKGVLVGRPLVTCAYGAGREGIDFYIRKLIDELTDTMAMCGAYTIGEITKDMIRLPR